MDETGARAVWLLLLPALAIAGFTTFLAVGLACSDDSGRAEENALAFCSSVSDDQLSWLALSGFAPLALALIGVFIWEVPHVLRWFNGIVFVLAGVGLTSLCVLATVDGVAFLIGAAWVLAAIVATAAMALGRATRVR